MTMVAALSVWTSTHSRKNIIASTVLASIRRHYSTPAGSMLRNAQHGLPALDVCVLGDADSANLSFISQHAAATKLSTE